MPNCEQRVEIEFKLLLNSVLNEVSKIPFHVVNVSIWEWGSLEWSVNVHEFSLGIPCAQCDSGFGYMCGSHKIFELVKTGVNVNSNGPTVVNVFGDDLLPAAGRLCVRIQL